jgi:hypothetical protein
MKKNVADEPRNMYEYNGQEKGIQYVVPKIWREKTSHKIYAQMGG